MRVTAYRLHELRLGYYFSFIFMTLTRETAYLDYKTTRGLIDRQTQRHYISPY
jgi:hypothetical protein